MTLDEMISMARVEANCPGTGGSVTDSEVAFYLNRGKDFLAQRIIKADMKYFEQDELLSFVANQAEYDIPRIFKDGKISLVERLAAGGTVEGTLEYIRFQDKEEWTVQEHPHLTSPWVYYLRERKVGFRPVPSATESNAVRVYGPQFPHDLIWLALPASGHSTTTFTLPVSGSDLKAGKPHLETDYYKNALFLSITGSNAGVERKCTAYNATTRTVTLESAWSVAVADQVVLLSKIPEEYHDALVQFAVARIAKKKPDEAVYKLAAANFRDLAESMVSSIQPRHIDRPDVIPYPEDDWELP